MQGNDQNNNPENEVLQRFRQFKKMFISSNVSNSILLDILEEYITSKDEDMTVETYPVPDNQLLLTDFVDATIDPFAKNIAA